MLHGAMDALIKDLNANEAARLLILLDDRLTSLINASEPEREPKPPRAPDVAGAGPTAPPTAQPAPDRDEVSRQPAPRTPAPPPMAVEPANIIEPRLPAAEPSKPSPASAVAAPPAPQTSTPQPSPPEVTTPEDRAAEAPPEPADDAAASAAPEPARDETPAPGEIPVAPIMAVPDPAPMVRRPIWPTQTSTPIRKADLAAEPPAAVPPGPPPSRPVGGALAPKPSPPVAPSAPTEPARPEVHSPVDEDLDRAGPVDDAQRSHPTDDLDDDGDLQGVGRPGVTDERRDAENAKRGLAGFLSKFRLPAFSRRRDAAVAESDANVEEDLVDDDPVYEDDDFVDDDRDADIDDDLDDETSDEDVQPPSRFDLNLRRLHEAVDQLSSDHLLDEAAQRTGNRIELRKIDEGLDIVVKGIPAPLGKVRLAPDTGHVVYHPKFGLELPEREPNRADLEIWMKAMDDVVVRVLEDISARRTKRGPVADDAGGA